MTGDYFVDIRLHVAVRNDDYDEAKRLIDEGVDIYEADQKGITPVDLMYNNASLELRKLFTAHQQYIERNCTEGNTPLHLMAKNGFVDLCEEQLLKGMDVNAPNDNGMSPLHVAAYYGHADVCELMLNNGAYVFRLDTFGKTPLDYAKYVNEETYNFLLGFPNLKNVETFIKVK